VDDQRWPPPRAVAKTSAGAGGPNYLASSGTQLDVENLTSCASGDENFENPTLEETHKRFEEQNPRSMRIARTNRRLERGSSNAA